MIEAIFGPAKRTICRKLLGFEERFWKGREEEKESYKYNALFTKKGILVFGNQTKIKRRKNPKLSHLSTDTKKATPDRQSRKKA